MIYFTFEKCESTTSARHEAGIRARNRLFSLFGIDESDAAKTESGKPYLKSGAAGFSISHCDNMALCALKCDRQIYDLPESVTVIFESGNGILIGCDIECESKEYEKDKIERISNRFLGYTAKDKDEFLRGWTRGEAYGKYTGEGVRAAKNIPPERTLYTFTAEIENVRYIFSICV